MKRLLVALMVAALLAVLAVPALAGQNKPVDPSASKTTSSGRLIP